MSEVKWHFRARPEQYHVCIKTLTRHSHLWFLQHRVSSFSSCDLSRMISYPYMYSEFVFRFLLLQYSRLWDSFFVESHIHIVVLCFPSNNKCPTHKCLLIWTCLVLSFNKQRVNRPKNQNIQIWCYIILLFPNLTKYVLWCTKALDISN